MPEYGGEHLSVAKALFQLDFYLNTLNMPFTVKDLYSAAYKERRGELYDDRWLEHIEDNPDVQDCVNVPFTTQSIIETLMRTGHEPIVRALMREVRKRHISFTQAYMIGTPRKG